MTKAAVVTYKPLKGQRDRDPTVSQEESLFGLLRQAEGYAYALRTVTISEASQIGPMRSWLWESGYITPLAT
jgi:hypothetical protein